MSESQRVLGAHGDGWEVGKLPSTLQFVNRIEQALMDPSGLSGIEVDRLEKAVDFLKRTDGFNIAVMSAPDFLALLKAILPS